MKIQNYLCGLIIVALATSTTSSFAQSEKGSTKTTTNTTQMDSVSYALGVLFASNIKDQGLTDLNPTELAAGFEAVLNGSATLDAAAADEIVRIAMTAAGEAKGAEEKAKGVAFLADNSKNEGIQATESGLQYRHDVVGEGDSPDGNDEVTVHYSGTLICGTEFDSSYKRGEPISFPLNGVIAGWTEGLQLMKIGGKTTFYIPEELAYGARPNPNGPIPPYAALVFVVELIDIKKVD
jgi:FKBP-type peptidyl-prolyl cis-trans isomerase